MACCSNSGDSFTSPSSSSTSSSFYSFKYYWFQNWLLQLTVNWNQWTKPGQTTTSSVKSCSYRLQCRSSSNEFWRPALQTIRLIKVTTNNKIVFIYSQNSWRCHNHNSKYSTYYWNSIYYEKLIHSFSFCHPSNPGHCLSEWRRVAFDPLDFSYSSWDDPHRIRIRTAADPRLRSDHLGAGAAPCPTEAGGVMASGDIGRRARWRRVRPVTSPDRVWSKVPVTSQAAAAAASAADSAPTTDN